MTHIAVIGNDISVTRQLQSYIRQYEQEQQIQLGTVSFMDNKEITGKHDLDCGIILLDVEMPENNGMQIAGHIRSQYPGALLILIGSTVQQALDGYSIEATDFILKPFNFYDFSECMTRAMRREEKRF